MTMTKLECGLDMEQVAQSACRVFCYVLGGPANWEGLSPEEQGAWLQLAKNSDAILTKHEGAHYQVAAQELFAAWVEAKFGEGTGSTLPWKDVPLIGQLAWQAVARHLHTLLDSDEISDLGAMESLWRPWAEKRLSQ
jgi:hypothetical protein